MAGAKDPARLDQQAKLDFEAGNYTSALENFRQAAVEFAAIDDRVNHAEQLNNVGVTLLQLGRAQEALDAVTGTEDVFARQGDLRRQGIAMNNRAAALQALHRRDEAIGAYEHAGRLLGEAGSGALQAEALKAAAALELRRGRIGSSGVKMLNALSANPTPNLLERALKALLRRAP